MRSGIWHELVHRVWANERLAFFRLSFRPVYDREQIVESLALALDHLNILSYAVYELHGDPDVLLRAWIPNTLQLNEFEDLLFSEMADAHLHYVETFMVGETRLHWPWFDPGSPGGLLAPDMSTIETRLSDSTVQEMNAGVASDETIGRLEELALFRQLPAETGIRFMLTIPHPAEMRRHDRQRKFRRDLVDALQSAPGVLTPSLYEGLGFAQYLVLARVDHQDYERFADFARGVNRLGVSEWSIRTTTTAFAQDEFMLFREALPSRVMNVGLESLSVIEMLSQPETAILEVKASAFLDVRFWLTGPDDALKGKPLDRRSLATKGFLKAVTGLLNTAGGTVILGALEANRYASAEAQAGIADATVVGGYSCVGVDTEIGLEGWDKYERELSTELRRAIRPDPGPWVHIYSEQVGDRTLAVLRVSRPSSPEYFLQVGSDPHYYIRRGGLTEELTGGDMLKWQRDIEGHDHPTTPSNGSWTREEHAPEEP